MTSVNAPQNPRPPLSLSTPPHRYRWLRLRTSAWREEENISQFYALIFYFFIQRRQAQPLIFHFIFGNTNENKFTAFSHVASAYNGEWEKQFAEAVFIALLGATIFWLTSQQLTPADTLCLVKGLQIPGCSQCVSFTDGE